MAMVLTSHGKTRSSPTADEGRQLAQPSLESDRRGGNQAFFGGRGVLAKLAAAIVAPALHSAVGQRAGMAVAGSNGLDARAEAFDGQRSRAIDFRAIAELAVGIRAPALGSTVDDSAGMRRASGDGLDARAETFDRHRDEGPSGGLVAELAIAIPAPALSPAVDHCTGMVLAGGDGLDA